VIVGPNPPMRQLVEQARCGVVVEHDNPHSILQGIQEIRAKTVMYKRNAVVSACNIFWESQSAWNSILFMK